MEEGGSYFVPAGDHYVTVDPVKHTGQILHRDTYGYFMVPSNVRIVLSPDARVHTPRPAPGEDNEMTSDEPSLFWVRKADNVSISGGTLVGAGRMRYGPHHEGWRNGCGIACLYAKNVVVRGVHFRDFQTHFDSHACEHIYLVEPKFSGINVSACYRFSATEDGAVIDAHGKSDHKGFPNPGIGLNRPYASGLGRFHGFSMGGWIVGGSSKILVLGQDISTCRNESMVIEGQGVRECVFCRIRCSHSKWGFASRGMQDCEVYDLRVENCWRSGVMLHAPEVTGAMDKFQMAPITGNRLRNVRVHNSGRRNVEKGRDDWPSIYFGAQASDNTIKDYEVEWDNPSPWVRPEEAIRIDE